MRWKQNKEIRKITHKMIDDELRMCEDLYAEHENDDIPDLDKFDKKMYDMFDRIFAEEKEKRKKKRRMIFRVGAAAAAVVVMIAAITVSAGRADALFAHMMKIVLKDEGTYTEIVGNRDNQRIEEFEGYYYPHYVPEGFEITVNNNMQVMGTIMYEKKFDEGTENIGFSFCGLDATKVIDSEDCDKINILINDRQGVLYSKKDGSYHIIVFQNEQYIFTVSGNVTADVLKDVAESIKK